MEADSSSTYTVIKLWNPEHRDKLNKYMEDHKHMKKTSFCRFYLRGLCIMKREHCKFAHDFDELRLWESEYKQLSLMECAITEKEERKRMFIQKTDFHQRPLFFLKKLDYTWLYQYQFSPRYKLSGKELVSQEEINRNQPLRHRIREIMHREQWDKVLTFLETTFPKANFTIDMLSCWFARLGFQKAQTFCRFGDFMRYLVYVRGYTEVNIVVPPHINRSIYFLKSEDTYMYSMKEKLIEDSEVNKVQVKKVKQERLKKMPANLQKKFICRFYMAGNCEKTRQGCFYVHNLEDMRYEKNQEFLVGYRQPPKSKEDKMNYLSLYKYYCEHKAPEDPELTLDDLNSKHGYKDRIRRQVHLQLYRDFLEKISQQYELEIIPVSLIKEEYQKMGFNHTDENKFGQLENSYWDLGYYPLNILSPFKQKIHCISKVPPLQDMEKELSHTLKEVLKAELEDDSNEKPQILESSIRRLVYSCYENEQKSVPLHIYLRAKKKSFKNVLQELVPEYCENIFFESVQQNFKKLMELVKKWLKKRKRSVQRLEDIDGFVRGLNKNQLNLNSFVNYRGLLELGLLEIGREIYFFPLANSSLVIDPNHLQKKSIQFRPSIPLTSQFKQKFSALMKERLVVVDNQRTLQFCEGFLRSCFKFGVDLEGRLSINGYIDLVQISCINEHKIIFVIDVFFVKANQPALYNKIIQVLKDIFQDEQKLKIMHSCQQDAVALWSCMDISLKGLFDTSGSHIYIQQKQFYRDNLKGSLEHIQKVIHKTKTPGLNQILQTWGAPKGKNELKEKMKKVFAEAGRQYFQKRPIEDEFLQYSARDVEDLIEVQERMIQEDQQGLWKDIGEIYASFRG